MLGVTSAPEARSGGRLVSVMFMLADRNPARSLNVFVRLRHSSNSGHEAGKSSLVDVFRRSTWNN
jgi:hypothetical protein